ELARAGPRPGHEGMSERAAELLTRYRSEWLPGCEGIDWMVAFRRGFAEAVEISPGKVEAFAAAAPQRFAAAPPPEGARDPEFASVEAFVRVPELGLVRCLRVPYLDAAGLRVLVGCAHLGGLRTLDLNKGEVGVEGVRALLGSPLLGQLSSLCLGG